ncbi:MAG: response regulator [Promethearchaeota archaeon]
MEKYLNEIPLVVRNSIKALCDENRQGILIYLEKEGPKSFIDISNDLKIPKNNLSHHIKILMRYGLLYNFHNKEEFDDRYSFYELSKLGKTFIDTLLNFIPRIRKILIIEDDKEIRKDFREMFENRNCIVDEAENGLEALNKVKKAKYNAIILDLRMPKMSGEVFLKEINNLEIKLRPIIIISAYLDNESIKKCIWFGARCLLKKPFSPLDLYNITKVLLSNDEEAVLSLIKSKGSDLKVITKSEDDVKKNLICNFENNLLIIAKDEFRNSIIS